jgi:hypothetical protein
MAEPILSFRNSVVLFLLLMAKLKVKVALEQATKAQRGGGRGIAVLFL